MSSQQQRAASCQEEDSRISLFGVLSSGQQHTASRVRVASFQGAADISPISGQEAEHRSLASILDEALEVVKDTQDLFDEVTRAPPRQ
jgi:ABC-type xylose transport system substrate-binding protein